MNKGDREYVKVLEGNMSYAECNQYRHIAEGDWSQDFVDAVTVLFKKDIDRDLLEDD